MKESETDEDRLRKGFAKLRDLDGPQAPPFPTLWRVPAARVRRIRPVWLVVAPALAAAAAVVVAVCGMPSTEPRSAVASAPVSPEGARARPSSIEPSPLDFLLEMPGTAFLGAVPDFDSNPALTTTKGRFR